MNNLSMAEIKIFQQQIKKLNTKYSNTTRYNKPSANLYAIIDDSLGINFMTNSGFGKYSTKFLQSLSTKQINQYISNVYTTNHLLQVLKSGSVVRRAIDNDRRLTVDDKITALWILAKQIENKTGKVIDSELIKDVEEEITEENLMNKQFSEVMNKMSQFITYQEYDNPDFADDWESIKTLVDDTKKKKKKSKK